MSETFRYDAFISYRHCELDSFISENLHKKLENFKLPKSVIKKTSPSKTKIERVFRDEAELPLSNNLSDPISEALANSEFLIVICTPNLPKSEWCKKEIETFVQLHDRKHVLLVLADGEIAGIGKDQKSLVLLSRYSPDVYYKVPILTYDEILEEADSVLSSYVPDRSILEKYSIE